MSGRREGRRQPGLWNDDDDDAQQDVATKNLTIHTRNHNHGGHTQNRYTFLVNFILRGKEKLLWKDNE
jgi:hypothetical protein